MSEPDYIHNGHDGDTARANLRMDMSNPKIHIVTISEFQHFVVAKFEDRAAATWDQVWSREKSYCGILQGDRWDDATLREGLEQIMRTGAQAYDLASWMKENVPS